MLVDAAVVLLSVAVAADAAAVNNCESLALPLLLASFFLFAAMIRFARSEPSIIELAR